MCTGQRVFRRSAARLAAYETNDLECDWLLESRETLLIYKEPLAREKVRRKTLIYGACVLRWSIFSLSFRAEDTISGEPYWATLESRDLAV